MTKKTKLLLGGHMSIAGGFDKAVQKGESIGCTVIQIFTRSNRQWGAKPLTQKNIDAFKTVLKNSSIQSVVVHVPYLINIGSPNNKTRHASLHVLQEELKRCDALGIKYLVMHPGSHLQEDEQTCLDRIVKGIDTVLQKDTGSTMLLLENMAGQGTNVGYTFEQLGYILKNVKQKKRVGICFDTCHAFAAGYDLRDKKSYDEVWKKFDKFIGLKNLKVLHFNDSKCELGSRVDRHEDVCKGKLGKSALSLLMNDPRFFSVPKILETPKPTLQTYTKNMKTLKSLLFTKTKKLLSVD